MHLKSLDLSGIRMASNTAKDLFLFLNAHSGDLIVSNDYFISNVGTELRLLGSAGRLFNQPFGNAIGGFLDGLGFVQTLNLYANGIGDDGMEGLVQSLQHVQSLRYLMLNTNSIGDKGIVALSQALKNVPLLFELDLGYNAIGDKGVQALAGALQDIPNLQYLFLHANSISPTGRNYLFEAIHLQRAKTGFFIYLSI